MVGGAELRRATHLLMELQLADTRVTGELMKVWAGIQMAPRTAAVARSDRAARLSWMVQGKGM